MSENKGAALTADMDSVLGSPRHILIFLALTAAISAPFYFLHATSTTPGAGAYIRWLMWSPAIAALLTLRIARGIYASIGWKWPPVRFVVLSCGIPILYIAATYSVGVLLGGGAFPNTKVVDATRTSFAFNGFPAWLVIALYLVVNGATRIVTETATALGEEIGWRGFLVPALAQRFGFIAVSLISGLIWSVWHFPLIFIGQPFNRENVLGALCFTSALTGISFAMTWLRLRSRSVWSAALAHSAHNVFNGMAGALIVSNAKSSLLLDETGIVMAGAGLLVALVFCFVNARVPADGVTDRPDLRSSISR